MARHRLLGRKIALLRKLIVVLLYLRELITVVTVLVTVLVELKWTRCRRIQGRIGLSRTCSCRVQFRALHEPGKLQNRL